MLKDVIKQLIMLHQNNIPFSLKERDIHQRDASVEMDA